MIYTLYCAKDRNYTHHTVEDNEKTQTIKCLFCGHTQINRILGRLVSVDKKIYEEQQKHEG